MTSSPLSLSGSFKGYGLVLYRNKSSSLQARHVLEGHEFVSSSDDDTTVHVLDCDWLKTKMPEEVSLHSKCLYVDRLPDNYRDMGEFRRLFSTVVNPPYCQVRRRRERTIDGDRRRRSAS